MLRTLIIMLVVFTTGMSYAQGIKFEKHLTWSQIKAKAKAENKFIFMDCYATWCGPCKVMAQYVFPKKDVGVFFNAHFINVAVQIDHTAKDADDVKQWYADADVIASKYGVVAFPTYLFFSPDGEAVDRLVGGFKADNFIVKAKDALKPEKQYYTLMNGVQKHLGDSVYLRHALETSEISEDEKNAAKIAGYYIECLKAPFKIEIVNLIIHSNPASTDPAFQFLLKNAPKIDQILTENNRFKRYDRYVEDKLGRTIASETITPLFDGENKIIDFNTIAEPLLTQYPSLKPEFQLILKQHFVNCIERKLNSWLYTKDAGLPDWDNIDLKLKALFPGIDFNLMLAKKQPEYYAKKLMWSECEKTTIALLDHYGNQFSTRDLNNYVWDYLFMHAKDTQSLEYALKWGKRAIDLQPEYYAAIDTYANVLYKAGKISEAVDMEYKAISKAEADQDEDMIKDLKANLQKMQKGKPTWTVDNN